MPGSSRLSACIDEALRLWQGTIRAFQRFRRCQGLPGALIGRSQIMSSFDRGAVPTTGIDVLVSIHSGHRSSHVKYFTRLPLRGTYVILAVHYVRPCALVGTQLAYRILGNLRSRQENVCKLKSSIRGCTTHGYFTRVLLLFSDF